MYDVITEMWKRELHYVRDWIAKSTVVSDWYAMKARAWSGMGDYSDADAGEAPAGANW